MEVKVWSTCILPLSSEITDKTNIGIHHRHLLNVFRIALLWGEWEEVGLYLWMKSLFTLIPSHQRGHFNWHKITCLSINTPQYGTVRYFAGTGNVDYQWKNENFSLVMVLNLLSGLLECTNMDTDSFLPFPEMCPLPAFFPCIFFYSSE